MEWYVFNKLNGPQENVGKFNIFNCVSFRERVQDILKKEKNYKKFKDELHTAVVCSFWCKYEYEIVLTPFPTTISLEEFNSLKKEYQETKNTYNREPKYLYTSPRGYKKIDIYNQLMLNWDVFAQYVWSFRKEVKNGKK